MNPRKYRWSKDYESAEEELTSMLTAKGIEAERWHLDAGEAIDAHSHDYVTRFWCAEGSIRMDAGGQSYSLQPGDTFELPSGMVYAGIAGIAGCICYEARIN